jgi:peptidoglycan/LPS O-acetylase OafA/YrhL
MVFLSHLSFLKTADSENLKWIYQNIFYEGYIGVSFFFILSGFILSYNYEELFSKENYSKYKFYIARFARIYPIHLLTLILAMPLSLYILNANPKIWFFHFLANLSLTQSFIPLKTAYFSFNSPSLLTKCFFIFGFRLLFYHYQNYFPKNI